MDLYSIAAEKQLKKKAPLADRMRPKNLDELVGQKHIIGKGKLLYRAILADQMNSIILHGPPGTGKTTLAQIIAKTTKKSFRELNAVTSGVKDIREVVTEAKDSLAISGRNTILFIDEIHRFNKSQQDALLPYVENGTLILIGATTENPYFEVNKALISRSMIFQMKTLEEEDLEDLLKRVLQDKSRGYGNLDIEISEDAKNHFINMSNGDARRLLNAIELGVLTTPPSDNGKIYIDLSTAEECLQKRSLNYEKNGDEHYDTISAFIKSMRGSDPNATLYWLAKMIYSGEAPDYIARRIVICASEDVGNADPNALIVAMNAFEAVRVIGMPEGRIILAQAAIYIACAPKSNASYIGINEAINDIENEKTGEIPFYLRDFKSQKMIKKDGGLNSDFPIYKYPHDYEYGYVKQNYMPNNYKKKEYYNPKNIGYERKIKERLEFFKKL
jgi:putative ATPase